MTADHGPTMPRDRDAVLAAIDELVHQDRIRDVLFECCRAVDRLEFDRVAELYRPDATDDHGFDDGTVADFIAVLKQRWTNIIAMQHHVSNVYVKLDGDYGEPIAYLYNWSLSDGPTGSKNLTSHGRYLDRYERRDDEWRFIHRRVVIETTAVTDATVAELAFPRSTRLTQGFPDERDLSYSEFRLFPRRT